MKAGLRVLCVLAVTAIVVVSTQQHVEGSATDAPRGFRGLQPQSDGDADAFVAWLKQNASRIESVDAGSGFDDLQPIAEIIGDARIVSLGEATHGTSEFFRLKHRLVEFLVEQQGFKVFAIEASYPDCVAINRYVLEGVGDPETALNAQGFWTWDTEEVLAMLRWMRAYNADPENSNKLHFYGIDMQNCLTAMRVAMPYLQQHLPTEVADLTQRVAPFQSPAMFQTYRRLPAEHRQQLTDAAAALVKAFDDHRNVLIAATSASAFAHARQHAVIVTQFEEMIRSMTSLPGGLDVVEVQRLQTAIGPASRGLYSVMDGLVDADIAESVRQLRDQWMMVAAEFQRGISDEDRKQWSDLSRSIAALIEDASSDLLNGLDDGAAGAVKQHAADVIGFLELLEAIRAMPQQQKNVRDRCMAHNAAWALAQHGPDAKMIIWAHNGHVSRKEISPGTESTGHELERMFGDDHVVFGFAFAQGSFQAMVQPAPGVMPSGPPLRAFNVERRRGSVGATFARAGMDLCAIDLRSAPSSGPVANWLGQPHVMRMIGAMFSPGDESAVTAHPVLTEHFDAMIFVNETTAAKPSALTRRMMGITDQ